MGNYLGKDIPKLGFGLMRLPMDGDVIDLEKTKEMTDCFLEAGFRYFDTAYGYNDGESEKAAKAALVDRYPRESFLLATNCLHGRGQRAGKKHRGCSILHWNGPEPDILTFTCYIIWARRERISSMIMEYGISCRRRKKRD